MHSSGSSLLSGTLLLTATGLFSQVLGFLYRIALSRLIGAEVMGLYQLIMPVFSVLLSLTSVGMTVAVSTLAARFHALGDWTAIRRVLRRGVLGFVLLLLPLARRPSWPRMLSQSICWETPAPSWASCFWSPASC